MRYNNNLGSNLALTNHLIRSVSAIDPSVFLNYGRKYAAVSVASMLMSMGFSMDSSAIESPSHATIMDTRAESANSFGSERNNRAPDSLYEPFDFLKAIGELNNSFLKEELYSEDKNLWLDIVQYGQLEKPGNPAITEERDLYIKNKFWTERNLRHAQPYLFYILGQLKERNLPVELAVLPVIESSYNPSALSENNAAGLWQLIPPTAKSLGLTINRWVDERKSIERSTQAALDYLKQLHEELGSWPLAIAAYNAGPSRVRDRIRKLGLDDFDVWDVKLPTETRRYVAKFFALNDLIARAGEFALNLPHINDNPQLVRVETGRRISLNTAAELAEIPYRRVQKLNSELLTKGTPPEGPHSVMLPASSEIVFKQNLQEAIRRSSRIYNPILYHTIKSGESLGTIAQQYNTSVSHLKSLNNLKGSLIKTGQKILVANYDPEHKPNNLEVGIPAYKVREGDTLSEIASMYGIKRSLIANRNNIDNDNLLRVGKVLIIPAKYIPADKSTISYSVRQGDTLSGIAKQFNIPLKEIKRLNPPLAEARTILPGQKVLIPTSAFY